MPPAATAIEAYFRRLGEIQATGGGTGETSYYGALETLLNAVGNALAPKVVSVSQLAEAGAGHPDFGLYTRNQIQRGHPRPGQLPERGVVEVKKVSDDAWVTAKTSQVSRYWATYRLVLVTNYRDFVLIGEDEDGNPVKLESLRLAT